MGVGVGRRCFRQRTAHVILPKQDKDQHLLLVHVLPIHYDFSAGIEKTCILDILYCQH